MWRTILTFTLCIVSYFNTNAQEWTFIKEKDGIKVYTKKEKNASIKSFRGEAVFNTSFKKLAPLLGTPESYQWWDSNVKDIETIEYKPEEFMIYYLAFQLPFPFKMRDLCAKASVKTDSVAQHKTVKAFPINGIKDEVKGKIRITDYHQTWDVQAIDENRVKIVLEGFVNPGGSIPDWLYNMVISESPIKIMNNLRKLVEKNQP